MLLLTIYQDLSVLYSFFKKDKKISTSKSKYRTVTSKLKKIKIVKLFNLITFNIKKRKWVLLLHKFYYSSCFYVVLPLLMISHCLVVYLVVSGNSNSSYEDEMMDLVTTICLKLVVLTLIRQKVEIAH